LSADRVKGKTLATSYSIGLTKWAVLAFDYQFVADPAYSAGCGPVSIFSARLHAEL
jgi:high affinity Mn2+ porin